MTEVTAKAKDVAQEVKDEVKEAERELDILLPSTDPVNWTLGNADLQREYIQKPLGYMKKMRLFALMGKTIRQALTEGGEGTLTELLGGGATVAELQSNFQSKNVSDAESFISLVSGFLVYVPDFLTEAFLILLNVPTQDIPVARYLFELDESEGGLSDTDGMEILRVGINQNWEAISRFFTVELPKTSKLIQTKREANNPDNPDESQ